MNNKEIASLVRKELKKRLPGWTFSVTKKEFGWTGSVTVALMSGPEDVGAGYEQLNRHYPDTWPLSDKGKEVMGIAKQVLEQFHWDESEIQIDYHRCNFYPHLHVGRWDKDFEVRS